MGKVTYHGFVADDDPRYTSAKTTEVKIIIDAALIIIPASRSAPVIFHRFQAI